MAKTEIKDLEMNFCVKHPELCKKRKGPASLQALSVFGSPTWTRTRDLRINSACASVEGINQKFASPLKSYTYTAGKSKHP
ncbi:hypothetical protein ABER38_12100, partial [Cutibacterium acnes]